MHVCHFLTRDLSLSVVMVMPWKFVIQLCPWTSSQINLNFLKETSSLFRSACAISNTRPFKPSDAISEWNKKQWDLLVSYSTPKRWKYFANPGFRVLFRKTFPSFLLTYIFFSELPCEKDTFFLESFEKSYLFPWVFPNKKNQHIKHKQL